MGTKRKMYTEGLLYDYARNRYFSHAGPTLSRVGLHVQHGDTVRAPRIIQDTQQQSQVRRGM